METRTLKTRSRSFSCAFRVVALENNYCSFRLVDKAVSSRDDTGTAEASDALLAYMDGKPQHGLGELSSGFLVVETRKLCAAWCVCGGFPRKKGPMNTLVCCNTMTVSDSQCFCRSL